MMHRFSARDKENLWELLEIFGIAETLREIALFYRCSDAQNDEKVAEKLDDVSAFVDECDQNWR